MMVIKCLVRKQSNVPSTHYYVHPHCVLWSYIVQGLLQKEKAIFSHNPDNVS